MTDPLDSMVDDAVRRLPSPRMPVGARERIRQHARRAFSQPAPSPRRSLYRSAVEPALVVMVCALQLVWLFRTVGALMAS